MEKSALATVSGRRRGRQNARVTTTALGDWIKARRSGQGMSQRELADRAGISRSYLCDIERGRGTQPSVHSLDAIAGALGADRTEVLRVAGILDPPVDPEESLRARRLVALYRGLNEANQESVERFARFLLTEEHRWVQARLVDGAEEPSGQPVAIQSGPRLFD